MKTLAQCPKCDVQPVSPLQARAAERVFLLKDFFDNTGSPEDYGPQFEPEAAFQACSQRAAGTQQLGRAPGLVLYQCT